MEYFNICDGVLIHQLIVWFDFCFNAYAIPMLNRTNRGIIFKIMEQIRIAAIILCSILIIKCTGSKHKSVNLNFDIEQVNKEKGLVINKLWDEFNLKDDISKQIFYRAVLGYYCIDPQNKKLTIIDYTKPSTEERFFVLDIKNKKLLFKSLVAHGKNSGKNNAKYFSNKPKSKKSCVGFLIASETYRGKHGYSLRVDGLEKNINDNARRRAIVIHGANYVNQEFIKKNGRLGRSWGCPALPNELSKKIIDSISNGSCIFINGNDEDYLENSAFIISPKK